MSSHDYAVEPTAFRDHRDLRYVLEKCGFHTGRFLVAFPGKWLKLVYDHLDGLPEMERKRAWELLKKYKDERVVRGGQAYANELSWVTNAARIKQEGAIADAIAAHPNAAGLPTIDDTSEEFFKTTERMVPARAGEYLAVARHLIQSSPRVVLVDPYFKLSRPSRRTVLEAFANEARQGRCSELHIICRDAECWEKGYPGRLLSSLAALSALELTIRIDFVDDTYSPYQLHARYLLSALGAIQFDRGFEEAAELRYVPIAPVSRELHEVLCKMYYDGMHGFTVTHTVGLPAR